MSDSGIWMVAVAVVCGTIAVGGAMSVGGAVLINVVIVIYEAVILVVVNVTNDSDHQMAVVPGTNGWRKGLGSHPH